MRRGFTDRIGSVFSMEWRVDCLVEEDRYESPGKVSNSASSTWSWGKRALATPSMASLIKREIVSMIFGARVFS
ncbi:hypothetical protein U1Q18_021606 [Sarracenia purpurea var. burkii]